MLYWIYDIPLWVGALLFAAVFVGFTWLGLVLIRPWVRQYAADQPDWNQLIRAISATFVVFYGVTLAMIAVSAYQSFALTNQVIGREAGRPSVRSTGTSLATRSRSVKNSRRCSAITPGM